MRSDKTEEGENRGGGGNEKNHQRKYCHDRLNATKYEKGDGEGEC